MYLTPFFFCTVKRIFSLGQHWARCQENAFTMVVVELNDRSSKTHDQVRCASARKLPELSAKNITGSTWNRVCARTCAATYASKHLSHKPWFLFHLRDLISHINFEEAVVIITSGAIYNTLTMAVAIHICRGFQCMSRGVCDVPLVDINAHLLCFQ